MQAKITDCRYQGDADLLAAIRADPVVQKEVAQVDTSDRQAMLRTRLLAHAVRVSPRVIPTIHHAFDALRQRTGITGDIEAYVVPEPGINAFVTRGASRIFVVLNGDTINALKSEELLFVIGHELGHAAFGHHDVVERMVFERLDPRRRMQLLALSRAQEISADRVGLLCCGDLDVATRALFRTASGITSPHLAMDPDEFDQQWDQYVNELVEVGTDDSHGLLTHPVAHLRIKALRIFWDAGLADRPDAAAQWPVDAQVAEWLAVLDPLARERPDAPDPILADFFLWGGLYMALSHGDIGQAERTRLAAVTSTERLNQALAAGVPSVAQCAERFSECLARRRQKLTASEINRLLEGLAQIAQADSQVSEAEKAALRQLAGSLRVNADLYLN
jgi:uncharacterized tellurite resistance protein B-like protein